MTGHAAEETRLKPVRGSWAPEKGWFNSRTAVAAAVASTSVLFIAVWMITRDKPIPRRAAGFASPPQVESKIASAQERLKVNPEDVAALVELGILRFEKGPEAYVDAIGDLEQARDLGALDARLFYCLGVMYQEEGLLPFALTEYKRFLRHYPEDKEVRQLLAKIYYRMGSFGEAISEYERLKFQHPNDPLIEENFGLSLWGGKQIDRAEASFNAVKNYGGQYARRAEFYLGQIALEAGKFDAAYEHYARVGADELPGIEAQRVWTGLGMSAQKLNKWEEARVAWENVVKITPADAKASAALREATRRVAAAKKAADLAAEKVRREAEKARRAAEKAAAQKAVKK